MTLCIASSLFDLQQCKFEDHLAHLLSQIVATVRRRPVGCR